MQAPSLWIRLLPLAAGALALYGSFQVWAEHTAPLKCWYLPAYAGLSTVAWPMRYTVYYCGDKLALDAECAEPKLSKVDVKIFRDWLQENIYGGESLWKTLDPVEWCGGVAFLLTALLINQWNAKLRKGTLIRGPEIIPKWRWNLRSLFRKRGFYIETK